MKTSIMTTSATLLLALGCASSAPLPTQEMADVQAAERTATELGAQKDPNAQLHLKLAQEQLAQAKAAMEKDDNENAARLLTRAKADAELAVALIRAASAKTEASKAVDQSSAQRSAIAEQGAAK